MIGGYLPDNCPHQDRAVQIGTQTAGLRGFRVGYYDCLTRWADALFEATDAVLCAPGPVSSVPALSLEPTFRRSHGSLYKALARGEIDQDRVRTLLMAHRPPQWPLIFAVDASSWARCDAETSPERGFYYSASKQSAGKPIVAGWSYQWIDQLDWAADSWTAPVDAHRIPPSANPTTATVEQVSGVLAALPTDREVPMFVFDAGYDAIALGHDLRQERVQVLVRLSPRRVFHPDPEPAPAGTRGRPARHGPRFALSEPGTWTRPDAQLRVTNPVYGDVHVQAWRGLHPKLSATGRWADGTPPIVAGTVIRVQVQHLPKPNGPALKTLWLWWSGPGQPDLDVCWRAYLRRFDIEHTYRFVKSTLGWTTPALQTPQQADRWTWLIIAAYTQLRLARCLVADLRLPWERRRHPGKLTPARVRRGFRSLRPQLDTPAHPPKSKTPGPGRPKGTCKPPRTRYPAIKKAA